MENAEIAAEFVRQRERVHDLASDIMAVKVDVAVIRAEMKPLARMFYLAVSITASTVILALLSLVIVKATNLKVALIVPDPAVAGQAAPR